MTEIESLLDAIKQAKSNEDKAKADRLQYESQLFTILENQRRNVIEGTVKLEEGATITYKMTRTVDTEALTNNYESLSNHAKQVVKWKADLDLKAYRSMQEFDSASFQQLAQYVTTKPAKPSITIK